MNNRLDLTDVLWEGMRKEALEKGYVNNVNFIEEEDIGYYNSRGGNWFRGYIEFNTPELKTLYLLKWS